MNDDQRSKMRHNVSVWGRYRSKNGVRRDIQLKNLSETGCQFYDRFTGLQSGDEITLRIENLGPFDATVRWVDAGYVGVQFSGELYGPTFDHIRLKLSG